MSQVFLNHKTEDKTIVLSVKKHLAGRFISAWLDSDEIPGGSKLNSSINEGIATNRYFIAFISKRYVLSDWCMYELEEAHRHAMHGNVTLIPVLLDAQDDLDLGNLQNDRRNMLGSILSKYRYIRYDRYNKEQSNENITADIERHNKIQLGPVVKKTVQGSELQVIQFRITANDGHLPTDFLNGWKLDIEKDFLAYHDDDQEKPLRAGKPVAFSGQGPNWLYAYLAVHFKNQCPVYIFNNRSNEYICVYDIGTPPQQQGKVLKVG